MRKVVPDPVLDRPSVYIPAGIMQACLVTLYVRSVISQMQRECWRRVGG